MSIWFEEYLLERVNEKNKNTMVENCGIIITELGEDFLRGTMPADDRNKQPFGIVHGGANCVLAETLGSIAANMTCDPNTHHAVGISITTNHVKAVRNGVIEGTAKPLHMGKTTQLWEIRTFNENKQMTSSSSLTMAIVSKLKSK